MKRWRRWLLEAGAVLGVFLTVRCYQTRELASGAMPVRELVTMDGKRVSLVGEAPALVHAFATWCGVCKLEEGSVQSVAGSSRVIGIASRSGSAEQVRAYVREHELDFPVVVDADGSLAHKLGVRAFPTSFFVSPRGDIVTREVGYTTELGLRLRLWFASR